MWLWFITSVKKEKMLHPNARKIPLWLKNMSPMPTSSSLGVPNLWNLMPDDPRWTWCHNSKIKCTINAMHLNYLQTIPHTRPLPQKNLSPTKLVFGTKRVGQCRLIIGQVMKAGGRWGACPWTGCFYSDETKDFPAPSLTKSSAPPQSPPQRLSLLCVSELPL